MKTFAKQINTALEELLLSNKNVLLGGQLIKYGFAGLTEGLYKKYPNQFITYSVSESLMNSSALGLALAGKKIVMMHVRIDFLASGMCALVNHIPIWYKKGFKLPITLICQIGKGMGQGPQHSKDLSIWFKNFEGWTVKIPQSPKQAYNMLKSSVNGNKPVMYIVHRELFNQSKFVKKKIPTKIKLCGSGRVYEKKFYKS
jgi:pyruvate/2-oxoglutarate/acetoin dehydrogenase E1 component